MKELMPLALGVPLALAVAPIRSTRDRWAAIVLGAVILGVTVSATVGELEESWAFAVLDTAQVLFATVCVTALRSRRTRSSAPTGV